MNKNIAIGILLAVCAVSIAQDSPEPPDHGAWYKAKDGWQKVETLTATGNSVHAFSGAIMTFRDAAAPTQLSDRRPVFYIKTTPEKKDMLAEWSRRIAIVQLEPKKDHRELKVVSSGLFGAKAGIDKKRMPDVTVHSVNDLMITIAPNEDLSPGEYLITADAMGRFGYDLEIK